MKSLQIKFPVILLAITLTVLGLSNCGQDKNAKNSDATIDTAKQQVEIPAVTADTLASAPASKETIEKVTEVKTEAKKIAEPVKKTEAKQTVIITKKTVTTTTVSTPASKPVVQPKPASVAKAAEPVKAEPVVQPKPAEVSKPVAVATPQTDPGSWVVPAKYKAMTSPYPNNQESITLGKSLFSTHCKSCHGTKGDGQGTKAASLDTDIRSFLSSGFKAQNQGQVYYKSMIGRGDMPKFEKKFPDDEDRWALVHYIMSL